MRHWKNTFVLVMVLCLMLPTAAFAGDTPIITAYKADAPITIDGSLDGWILDSPIVIEDESQLIRDASFWQGPTDLSCKVYVMWDEGNLYLAADVTEDTPFGAIEMLELDGQDNLKLYISTDPTAIQKEQPTTPMIS